MFASAWSLLKTTVNGYIDDDALSRGAAIAYYTVTAIAPVLVIVIAIAGLAFGQEAAQGAIVTQLSGMMGPQSAETLQAMIRSASDRGSGILATIIGLGTLLITASGVFGEMQAALNVIWKAQPNPNSAMTRLVRTRIASLGLVMSLGFLLMVSLVVSAGLTALGDMMNAIFPGFGFLLSILNFVVSLLLISVLFGLIYKVLPDKPITWRDVAIGAVATASLFTVGKFLIGLYLGSSAIGSSYGAAGAIVLMLLWVYYSSQIFLFGAEFTKAFAERHGSHADAPTTPQPMAAAKTPTPTPTQSLQPPAITEAEMADLRTAALAALLGAAGFGLGRFIAGRTTPGS